MAGASRDWRIRLLLLAAAVAPFVPAAVQFLHRGVPDYLFTGDGATIELRTLHAAHGEQFLGPYSRFNWSHPGPMFFYLALPVYELFGERGPALNLFMFVVNLCGAISIVMIAYRLRGLALASMTAGLLATFELIALPFVQTGEWNPVSPIFALVLLSMLTAPLALGELTALPVFVFVASAIVQTHIGFAPEVLALTIVAAAGNGWRIWAGRGVEITRRSWWIAGSTGAVLVVCWMLPVYESMTNRPGNLAQLVTFFTAPHGAEHPWNTVFTAVFQQVSAIPLALLVALRIPVTAPGPLMGEAITIAIGGVLVALARRAVRRRDPVLGVMVAIGLAQIVAAVFAVRAIRGELLPYLTFWAAVPSLTAFLAIATALAADAGIRRAAGIAGGVALLVVTMLAPVVRAPVIRGEEIETTRLAHQVADYLSSSNVSPPILRMASGDTWPSMAAVALHLKKRDVPFYVDPAWAFMFGKSLVDPGGEHPVVLIGDRAFDARAGKQPGLERAAAEGGTYAYLQPPGYLAAHRIMSPLELSAATGVGRNPLLVVDGAMPTEGTSWDSPASAILTTTASAVTVRVPRESNVAGFFASVDGNDLYSVRCGKRDRSWPLGVTPPEQGVLGMQTRWLFEPAIADCETITLVPVSGDGYYSVAEIGFLHR